MLPRFVVFSHYFVHGGFFQSDSQVLDNVDKIRHIPTTIVQGRYDVICPATTAWQLHKVGAHVAERTFRSDSHIYAYAS